MGLKASQDKGSSLNSYNFTGQEGWFNPADSFHTQLWGDSLATYLWPLTSLRNRASKARGSRSFTCSVSVSPRKFANRMSAFLQNSQMIWRQVPHGGVSDSVSATIASLVKFRSPSESAFQIATRSAQTVSP